MLLIDADGCPVVDIALRQAKQQGVPCTILCDMAHVFKKEGATTITLDKGADSVDFALANRVRPGDVVITQDYGLAAMCLAKGAFVLSQNGMEYTAENIDSLLAQRHMAKMARKAGQRTKGPAKRTAAQNEAFAGALAQILRRAQPPAGGE